MSNTRIRHDSVQRLLIMPRIILFVAVILVGRRDSIGYGADPQYDYQFFPAEAIAGDEFGRAVDMDGQLGIIGAPSRFEVGEKSGAAYIYDLRNGTLLHKLLPEDPMAMASFGNSVAIDGNLAVVGAMLDSSIARSSGAAYVFDVTTGQQLYKLIASDAASDHEFGVSVDIDHEDIIVGAHKDGAGSAYLFDASNGQQVGKLRAEDASLNDLFGVAVSIDQGIALIGARYDDDGAIAAGAAYLFDVETQKQLHKLVAHDPERGDRYGMHLGLGGNRAVVGSRYDDDAVKSSGSAYVYDVETGAELFKLVPSDTTPNDQFGSAVSVSGDYVLIGALDDDHNGPYSGSAYLFNVNTGEELYKINVPDATRFDRVGIAAAMDGDTILLGASMLDYAGTPVTATGKAYVYRLPEPSTACLAVLGGVMGLGFHRRRRR